MHELSFAARVVEVVGDALPAVGGGKVCSILIKLGELSGLDADCLRFGFEVAARGTPLEGSRLDVKRVPVAIHCPDCDGLFELPDVRSLRCPVCGAPSADVRRGREVEVESFEVDDEGDAP